MNNDTQMSNQKSVSPRADETPRVHATIDGNSALGYLVVSTGTANKAYPLEDVRIEIYLMGEDNQPVLFRTQISDISGIAEAVPIPTPPKDESLSPGNPYLPYTTAQVRVFKDGYYPIEAREVPIFAGIKSLQYFDLVPIAGSAHYNQPTGELIIVSDQIPDPLM